ncbi:MAG: cell division protein ZipA, partial [Hydrocarboniphaga effusa]|nr:cell division protein ZipA [Hydrocarboniphaga effusa]
MTTLQWALLLLGVGIIAALVLSNRRERRLLERSVNAAQRSRGGVGQDWTPALPPEEGTQSGLNFDEYGVGKPRKRTAPRVSAAAPAPKATPAPEASPKPAAPDKLIALYIAEHEGTNILGPKIHAALQAQGLRFGGRKIYHRFNGEQPVFSVASLVKPGTLDPAEARDFSTPGLSVFMQLPGPGQPEAALKDMLSTARQLARALNAELYDTEQRQPLTPERERVLQTQVS